MTDAGLAAAFDLRTLPAAFYDDPYPTYRALREHEPRRRMQDGSIFLTAYADHVAVYRDAHRFSSDKRQEYTPKYGAGSPLFEHHTTSLVFNDPPLHTRVRRLIAGALTSRAVADMAPSVVLLVDGLLDRAERIGRFDLIADFAAAIPVEVIGNLLDIPHDERAPLRDWSLAILGALEPSLSKEQEQRGNQAVRDFTAYLKDLVARRRRRPGDPARDVLTRLIEGEGEDRLSETELLQNCIFILNAGHETTTNLIGNALHTLLAWPEARRTLIADPAAIKPAVEEFLRFESSNQLGNRITTTDVALGELALPAGTRITLCIGAANRDPAQFAEPDRLDITRWPNRHLAFGFGLHQCAGLMVARLEAADRDFAVPRAVSGLSGRWAGGARRPRPVSRLPVAAGGARLTPFPAVVAEPIFGETEEDAIMDSVSSLTAPTLSGFGNEFATEALPGALPQGRNSPQRPPLGLYAEQISGTPFTVPRHESRRTWLYRIRPSAVHPPYRRMASTIVGSRLAPANPNRLRWNPLPLPDAPTDFLAGLTTMVANAAGAYLDGVSVHLYRANRSMQRIFWNADGEMLIVPQQGRLVVATELGRLQIGPGEIMVLPRGVRFAWNCSTTPPPAMSAKTTVRCCGFPNSARSAPTAWPIRATSSLPQLGLKIVMGRCRWCRNSWASCGKPSWTIRRSTWSPGTAATRRINTTSRGSTRSARSASTTRIRRSSPC